MKRTMTLVGAVLALIQIASVGAFAHTGHHPANKMAGAKSYECAKCHMKFTAAQAKKDHYKDPMDGGKLMPAAAAPKKAMPKMDGGSMPGMKM